MGLLRQLEIACSLLLIAGCSSTSVTQNDANTSGGSPSGASTSSTGAGGTTTGKSSAGNTQLSGGASSAAATISMSGSSAIGGTFATSVSSVGGAAIGGAAAGGAGAGSSAAGGAGAGGAAIGGAAAGGAGAGSSAAGGAGAGGAAIGGAAAGGAGAGGSAAGGAGAGGVAAGGSAAGGAATGGAATGGAATGGAATGGAATGGAATGGAPTGGAATGGAPTGGAPNWCQTLSVPSGVVAADYQCIDFDTGMPPTSTWTQTLTNSGTMSLFTERASSAPNSLATTVLSADTYALAGAATLSWKRTGSNPITSVSVSAYFSPTTLGGVAPAWTGAVSLMCIAFGSGTACLDYTYKSTNLSFQTTEYTGYFIEWMYVGGAAVRAQCAVTGSLSANIWTRVELRVTQSSSTVDVLFGGALVGSCSGAFDADTVSTVTVGPKVSFATSYNYTMYYDNVLATVAR